LVEYLWIKGVKSIGVLSISTMKYRGNTKLATIYSIVGKRQPSFNVNLVWVKGTKIIGRNQMGFLSMKFVNNSLNENLKYSN
jgi:hypothetical protein